MTREEALAQYAKDRNLSGANLRWANLYGANLRWANLPHFSIVPEEGTFIAWKKTTNGVVKLRIPAEAKRMSSLVGRKCRAEFAEVIEGNDGTSTCDVEHKLTYSTGAIVRPASYDDDIRVECSHGIHFFMTKKEAEEF